ncbi:carboxypeptidase family protein [Litorimonas taeanensis]|uniref:Carboxypeptidase family protein n=1 Tax=Litorimonas taeanensis TaxID=568099 RepID=A0A420WJN1_9PROT|nr:TonB-dependent receptor [Litorimonas taeanensis]RKQ71132.1 carboxypeptidase family protein [Litorimonas taeanensis]
MKNQISSLGFHAVLSSSVLALTIGLATSASAQVTTSEVQGYVTTNAAAPIANATITLNNTSTGLTRTITTDNGGFFNVRNLPVTGLYNVTVSADGYSPKQVQDIALQIGGASALNFTLDGGSVSDEIIVVGQRQVLADVAIGPNAVFNLETLENAPAINRDIKDIIRIDPRVYIDETFNDGIQCSGANPRFNSFTIDGLSLNDNFGLNSNGYPTERIPYSFDAIEQVSVELSPIDVEYGAFTACSVNAVTKSGTNEIHGKAFFDYATSSLKGDKAGDLEVSNDGFEEKRYGFSLGLPVIKDKLFLFGAYEKQEGSNLFGSNTPAGTGVDQADFDRIIDIATNDYGYVSGGLPTAIPNTDEKIIVKADWNINDFHRLTGTYVYNDGFSTSASDSGFNRLADGNHFYERGAKLNSYAGSLYSDWTENFSTEFTANYIDLDNRQIPVAGVEFGEVQIRNIGERNTTVYLGADDSRHANELNYTMLSLKAAANYTAGDHTFKVGVEREEFDVFNLFVQEVQGEWVFDSIDDFENGDFSDFRYENAAGSNDQNDAAANFKYEITSFYGQDTWQVTPNFELILGLRYDEYSSDDAPRLNQGFVDTFGFANNANLDGKDLLQPRVGFNYLPKEDWSIRGGLGIFSGGNPNVWISNNYSNDGVTQFEYRVRGGNVADFTYPNSGNVFFEVPQEGIDTVASAQGGGNVNALDPNFKIPSVMKASLGTTFNMDAGFLGNDYLVNLDFLYSVLQDSAVTVASGLTQSGVAPDGRPIFSGNPFTPYLLTNSEDDAKTYVLSANIAKDYDFGLNWSLGYAYTDADDVSPMTSSTAGSNWGNVASSNSNDLGTATSNYQIKHRFTAFADFGKEFIDNYETSFSVFASLNSGRPYSYTFGENSIFESFRSQNRSLFYVPTGVNDPLADTSGLTDQAAFFSFLESSGLNEYAGQIAPRNAFEDDWWAKVDLKLSQELPGFRSNDRVLGFITLENALNFIDSDWGVLEQHGFPGTSTLVDVDLVGGQYVYSDFNSEADQGFVNAGASTWEIRVGASYEF